MIAEQFESVFCLPVECFKGTKRIGDCFFIKPGEEVKAEFSGDAVGAADSWKYKYRLKIKGEVDLRRDWRGESSFDLLYRLIDDSLCTDETHHSRYSLKLSSGGEDYPRKAFSKVVKPYSENNTWEFGAWFKKTAIKAPEGYCLSITAEVYYKKECVIDADIAGEPDERHIIEIEDGSCDWIEKHISFTTLHAARSILVSIIAENYSGTLWLEDPYLINSIGKNFIHDFVPSNPYKRRMNWLGHNLSRKEWPEFEFTLNGTNVFTGELFERIFIWPSNDIEIPAGIINAGANRLAIKHTSKYHDPLPYKLKSVEFIRTPANELNIISCPELVPAGQVFTVLVSVRECGMKAVIGSSNDIIMPLETETTFESAGLNALRFKAERPGMGAEISIKAGDNVCFAFIERVVDKQFDNILTGTGDAIYINQNIGDMEHFLSWYLHNHIGNCITFRPVYRWSGSRVLKPNVWKRMVELCNRIGLNYCLMVDGRELPGATANPGKELIEGPYFMGMQAHEFDGPYDYFGIRRVEGDDDELFWDIWRKTSDSIGIIPNNVPVYTAIGVYEYMDPHCLSDMEEGVRKFIDSVRCIAQFDTRHTGVSVFYKYFYQAGVEWQGAEVMYGPQEIILSALRGASRAYGRRDYGAHLAMQWNSSPHDTPQKYRRYMLSLYICYMHGVQHINTEEGLWKIEGYDVDYERFSDVCINHKKMQQDFYRFELSHTRRGGFHTPMAFLHGNYDAWAGFSRGQVWGQTGEEWAFGYPEESWDLIKVFYPLSVIDSIYRRPCPDMPQGWYTGTPYGVSDILPVEADSEIYDRYRILAFLGWNTADQSQLDKLVKFVENGGTLLLGWPHLYTCVKRSEAMGKNTAVLNNDCTTMLTGLELQDFIETVFDGKTVTAGKALLKSAKAILENADGIPIVVENMLGKGKVIFVNIKAYPAEESVKALYTRLLHQLGQDIIELEKANGWLRCSSEIGFTVYDHNTPNKLRTIYFINIDWWNNESIPHEASLLWGGRNIKLNVDRGNINILTLSVNWAVWTYDNETDVIDMQESENSLSIKLQGMGSTEFIVFNRELNNQEFAVKAICLDENIIFEPLSGCDYGWRTHIRLNGPDVLKITVVKSDVDQYEMVKKII